MQLKTLLLSVLPAVVLASPIDLLSQASVNNPNYTWSVTSWSAGSGRAGSYYDFNIAAPAFGGNPAFAASCHGDPGTSFLSFAPCVVSDDLPKNRRVAAHLLEAETGTGAHIEVSYVWVDQVNVGTYYNLTGHATTKFNQFVAPLQNFTITPSSIWGVA